MKAKSTSRARGKARTRHAARAPMAVRVVMAAVAALLIVAGVFACINLYAVYVYNQATASLESNLEAAADESTDLQLLSIQQEQTDAMFEEAGSYEAVLLPDVSSAIEHNAATSAELTARVAQELAEQQGADEVDGTTQTAGGTDDSDGQGGGLTAEQREQIEELLESNQSSTSSDAAEQDDDSDGESGSGDEETESVKPW